ncbi:MAG: glycosyltransferase N-terminal domain-containing protein [Acidobacteriota bacterium]
MILIKGRKRWRALLSRCGVYPRGVPNNSVWLHALGPGEMRVAIALVLALPQDLPVVITSDGSNHGFAQAALGGRVELASIPLPFLFAWRRFLRRYSPRQLILIEATGLFPLLCLHLLGWEIPTALVNGWFTKEWLAVDRCSPLVERVQLFGVRDEGDRERLAGTGVGRERISVTGDVKFDATAPPLPGIEAEIRTLAGERPILIAGSTHSEEDGQILDAFERLGGGDRALLILAPRHGFDRTDKLLRERDLDFVRRSRFPAQGRPSVVLLDSMGELASLYRHAAAVFVGYSLTPRGGGHNPIEPARFAVPIAVGPYTSNFQFHADLFDRAGAWQRVASAEELARVWGAWLDDLELARQMGRRAADVVELERGLATSRTLALLKPFLGLDDDGVWYVPAPG